MEAASPALGVILGFVGLFLVLLGYLIRYRKRLRLIGGYRADRVRDPDGLARFFGGWTVALGVAHAGLALVAAAYPLPDVAWVGYVLAVIAWLVVVGGYADVRYGTGPN